jgi:hypothetical protein
MTEVRGSGSAQLGGKPPKSIWRGACLFAEPEPRSTVHGRMSGPKRDKHGKRTLTPRGAFYLHRFNATGRKISFEFTYEQWVAWWEEQLGPDWFERRGPWRGCYVMARRGDVGPYHPDNVMCVLHSQNNGELLTAETRTQMSTAVRKRFSDPAEREKQSKIQRRRFSNPIEREKQRERTREVMSNPARRTHQSVVMLGNTHLLGFRHSAEQRAKWSAEREGNKYSLGRKLPPAHRAAISAAQRHYAKIKQRDASGRFA